MLCHRQRYAKPQTVSIKTHRLRIPKVVRIFCRLWYNCGQTKNHRRIGGDFSRNGGPNRDRTDDLTDANRTLSQLSYRPILLLFAGFCNKKQIFKFFYFRRFRRKFSPKLWAETHRSICDHRDANRTLSQLSYGPLYGGMGWNEIVPPHYYTHFCGKCKCFIPLSAALPSRRRSGGTEPRAHPQRKRCAVPSSSGRTWCPGRPSRTP